MNQLRRSGKNSNLKSSTLDRKIPSTLAGLNSEVKPSTHSEGAEKRLDSWKEIAVYLDREVRTVQRWEKREHLPVHRHLHSKIGSIYAFKHEIDSWRESRSLRPTHSVSQSAMTELVAGESFVMPELSDPNEQTPSPSRRKLPWAWKNMDSVPAIIYFRTDTDAFQPLAHGKPKKHFEVIGIPFRREMAVSSSARRMAAAKS